MNNALHTHQTGAALVVALILLVALSLMAISSMNTASLDLIMAGNEQYRSRAFVAAEAGVENGLVGGTFDCSLSTPFSATANVGSGSDAYTYTTTCPGNGAVEPPPPGNSEGTFGTVYFRITSAGRSERGTAATSTQELYEVVKSADGVGYKASCGTASLDDTISSC